MNLNDYQSGNPIKIWHHKTGWVLGTIHDVGIDAATKSPVWLEIDFESRASVVYLDSDGYSPLIAPPF